MLRLGKIHPLSELLLTSGLAILLLGQSILYCSLKVRRRVDIKSDDREFLITLEAIVYMTPLDLHASSKMPID